ncbi:MAG: hypothetical protein O7B35_15160 [Deltaproteobacteria bacterium]|nr:hypothetical protein [Deltaproteobacteria bacterium]
MNGRSTQLPSDAASSYNPAGAGIHISLGVAVGKGSDRVAAWLDSLAGEAVGKGAETAERGVAEREGQKLHGGCHRIRKGISQQKI